MNHNHCDDNYIWRCAKCSCHFANITKINGNVRQEKKCPKCKALNLLNITNQEINIRCKVNNQENQQDLYGEENEGFGH